MDLKDRKRIYNLPRYDFGLSSLSFTTGLPSTGVVQQLPDEKMGLLKMENSMLKSGQFISNGNGGLEAVTKVAPKSGAGAFLKNNVGGIADAAMSAINFAGTIGDISKNKISSDEMMGSGGTSLENVNGINYTKSKVDEAGMQNLIDATAKAGTTAATTSGMATGAALGSIIPGLGTAVGGVIGGVLGGVAGLFGSRKAKEEAERLLRIARNRTQDANSQRRDIAYTIGLRNQFNRENETDESQSLFHAALGVEDIERDVDPRKMRTKHKHLVDTAEHGVVSGFVDSFGSEGETMISGKADKNGMHKVHRIRRGPNDTAPMNLKKRDTVGSRLFMDYETGLPIADAIYLNALAHGGKISTEDKQRYEMNLNVERMMLYVGKRKGDVLPGYLGGTNKIWGTVKNIGQNLDLENVIPTVTAFTTAALRDAQAEGGLRAPKSFVANPYENAALDELNKLHSDYYTVWAGNREAEGRAKSSIAQSGGLSAGQRMLAYMGMLNQTLQNNANAMFDAQKLNNEYRGQAAKIKLATGENSATRQAEAYRWDEDMLAKANAARLNMWETSAYDRQNALESFFHNRFKKQQFDRTMNLYESQLKVDAAKTKAIIDSLYNNNKPSKVAKYTPTLKDVASTATTAKGMQSIHPSLMPLPAMQNVDFSNLIKALAVQKPAKRKTTKRGGAR